MKTNVFEKCPILDSTFVDGMVFMPLSTLFQSDQGDSSHTHVFPGFTRIKLGLWIVFPSDTPTNYRCLSACIAPQA